MDEHKYLTLNIQPKISSLIILQNGFCGNLSKQLCDKQNCRQCYERSFASHEKIKYWSNLNPANPRLVFKSSHMKYLFVCDKCPHIFEKSLTNIVKGSWCPYCANQKLCVDPKCDICHNKSLASSEIAQKWSQRNFISSRQVFKNSNKTYIFECPCGHSYNAPPNRVIKDRLCSFCGNKKLCDDINCISCYQKSFASHHMAKYWSKDNSISSRMVFMQSHDLYKFDCECKHSFNASLNSITNMASWCPFCCMPPKELCTDNNCVTCYEKSFASHEKTKFWSNLNPIHPRFVFKSSGKEYLFNCGDCNELYKATPNHISNGKWCPCKKNKTETILYKFLSSNYSGLIIERQKKFDWCKNIGYLPFDFCIESLKLLIELDGRQHFVQVHNWESPEHRQENDIIKMISANKHNYSVIRIYQEDVWMNKIDWEKILISSVKLYNPCNNILIGDIYDRYPIYKQLTL